MTFIEILPLACFKVKSMSSEVLTATLLDMESVLLHDESAEAIFRDLADDDIINSENQNLSLEPRMKRQLESTTSNQMANQTGFCLSGCRIKRQRKEVLFLLHYYGSLCFLDKISKRITILQTFFFFKIYNIS